MVDFNNKIFLKWTLNQIFKGPTKSSIFLCR
jgi:hypothetical protein